MKYALCLIITALISYFWGSLNSAIIVVKLAKGEDIREKGSGNAGLTNVLRVYGKGAALATLLCDLFKGVAAVVAARLIVGNLLDITFFNDKIFIGYVAGLFTMIGHIFPIYYGFHGGKGVLLAATTLIAMDPLTCVLSVGVFAIVLAITKYVSVGSISAAVMYPVFTIITQSVRHMDGRLENFLITLCIGALIVYMHKPNIKRLIAGNENKFGQKKVDPAENDTPEIKN
ncbi:glycerol-3-phosphate acyltransferase [Ruminococcus sp. CAG:579]|jgi:glycerol-3-phosphate acyltransferase PlsY|uniref:glycerol-3-phosphate 1-O-acyltransferase PlsY n=1 Tax=Ruminococcus sp. 210702-SL.1.03 TaxID=2883233 RepID=UPI00033693EB|nr:glycerol-3-phosphate 1-O-acyltransferase PlsY [Ruminococcus sp. 210702-SL.1.03]MCB6616494.1 glycerol-3-phosphate 1-O-acyltransferase PlsY [Ruminococcus sp. 210702-SL.1.03]CDA71717.1 glycerol-3-phosphate acyltransferase [Ruminococcus sp. CAG:579]